MFPTQAPQQSRVSKLIIVLVLLCSSLFGCTGEGDGGEPSPSQPSSNIKARSAGCPRPFTIGVRDYDLCSWSQVTEYGDYARIVYDERQYATCTAWKDDLAKPTPTGIMDPEFRFKVDDEGAGSMPGKWLVKMTFEPDPGASTITLMKPRWTDISVEQIQRLDNMLDYFVLLHERGHQNFAGQVAKNASAVVEVAGNNFEEAEKDFRSGPYGVGQRDSLKAAANAIGVEYDALTAHALKQSVLGGSDPEDDICGMTRLRKSNITAYSQAAVLCEDYRPNQGEVRSGSQESRFEPEPPRYPQGYKSVDNSQSSPDCVSSPPVNNVIVKGPFMFPKSEEVRTVTNTVTGGGTHQSRVLSASATAGASTEYVAIHPKPYNLFNFHIAAPTLLLRGSVSCQKNSHDSAPHSAPVNRELGASATSSVELEFSVEVPSRIRVTLAGTRAGRHGAADGTLRTVKRPDGWTESLAIGADPFRKTLDGGTYSLTFSQECSSSVQEGSNGDNVSGDMTYNVRIEN